MAPLAIICGLIWLGGSVAFAALMPWRTLEREDRWLCWVVVLGWPPVLLLSALELLYEHLSPRKKPWWTRGRP